MSTSFADQVARPDDQETLEGGEYPSQEIQKFDGPVPPYSNPMTQQRLLWSLSVIGWSARTCVIKATIQAKTDEDPLVDLQIPLPMPMRVGRVNFCLAVMGWSRNALSRRLCWNVRTARRMYSGDVPVLDSLAIWLDTMMRIHHSLRPYAPLTAYAVRSAIAGTKPVPDPLAAWIDGLVRVHECLPLPVDWRGKAAAQYYGTDNAEPAGGE